MKKILITIMMFIPFMVKGSEIKKIYIESEVDISGNLIVKEIIDVKNHNEDMTINLFYKNEKATDNDKENYGYSKIHNGEGIQINNIGILKENYEITKLSEETFVTDNVTLLEEYNSYDKNGYKNIVLTKTDKDTTYYIEYIVLCTSVKHKDSAELYYKYLNKFNYNIKEVMILTKLPFNSKLFEVWAHGKRGVKVVKDNKSPIVVSKISNYKKGEEFDLRILYDRDIFSIAINDSKKTNENYIDAVKAYEKNSINEENYLPIVIAISAVLLIVFTILTFKKGKIK